MDSRLEAARLAYGGQKTGAQPRPLAYFRRPQLRPIRWEYTRGHAGDPDNERCDEIAQGFSRGGQPELRQD